MLKLVSGDAAVTMKTVYKWFERFRNGCESVEDEERSRRPSTSKTQENAERVSEMIRSNRRLINTLFLFQFDTLLFFFLHLQFSSYNFLYMFRTGWSIISRIKLHVQHLAPFPRSLLSRAWPLVLTK